MRSCCICIGPWLVSSECSINGADVIPISTDSARGHGLRYRCHESSIPYPAMAPRKSSHIRQSGSFLGDTNYARGLYIWVRDAGKDDGATVVLCPGVFLYPWMHNICVKSARTMVSGKV